MKNLKKGHTFQLMQEEGELSNVINDAPRNGAKVGRGEGLIKEPPRGA